MKETMLIRDLGLVKAKKGKSFHRRGTFICGGCDNPFTTQYYRILKNPMLRCTNCTKRKHGMSFNKHYARWSNMIGRCYNKNDKAYLNYGGRGIGVCNDWRDSPTVFIRWCESNYKENQTLDRRDNDKGYSPDNCRFVTNVLQGRNTRFLPKNNIYGYKGITKRKNYDVFKSVVRIGTGEQKFLGMFRSKVDGARAYNDYIIKHKLLEFKLNPLKNLKLMFIKLPKTVPSLIEKNDRVLVEGVMTLLLSGRELNRRLEPIVLDYDIDIELMKKDLDNIIRKFKLEGKYLVVEKLLSTSFCLAVSDNEEHSSFIKLAIQPIT